MAGIPPITKAVIPGGPNAIEAFIVGELRELRVDEDNDSLRVHDGVKEGGYEFLNRDENDGRYQFHSPELDGFEFGAQEKGILCRVGPAQYKTRKLTANTGEFDIQNPRGTAADIYFELLEEITTEHVWFAQQTFVERILANDGLDGDTFGTHHGDVIGGNISGVFTGDGHGDFDGTFTGDVNVSGHNFVTDDGQILEEQIDPQAWIRRGIPLGGIIMWSGVIADIPASWALCDGDNGTPDLRNRFVVGAGDDYDEGDAGGNTSGTVSGTVALGGEHTHDLLIADHELTIAELASHNHDNGVSDDNVDGIFTHGTVAAGGGGGLKSNTVGGLSGLTSSTGDGDGHTHAGSTATLGGQHTHDISLDAVDLLPPYFALCFIMKIA